MLNTVREAPNQTAVALAGGAVLVVLAATAMGLAAVFQPELTVLGILGLAILVAFVRAPAWMLVVIVISVLATADVVRSELLAAGVPRTTAGMLGLGRVSLGLAMLAIARMVLRRDMPRVPTGVLIALAVYILAMVLQAQVSMVRGTAVPTILSDIQREISYMGGFLIGLIAVQSSTSRIRLYRAFAIVAIACSIGSILYWAWATGVIGPPPILGEVFEHTRTRVIADGFDRERAKFPFVYMHPNSSGFVFVIMAVFAIPPLLQSVTRGDRLVAIALLAATVGGVLSTQSRTALLALAAGTLAYVVLTRGIPTRTRAFIIGAVAVIGIGTWALYGVLLPEDRAFTDVGTLESRQVIWEEAFALFAQAPLLGNGFQVSTFGLFGASDGGGQSVHNEYLGRLVDGGLVGFAMWMFVVGTFAAIAFSLWRGHGTRSAEGTSLLAFLVVLGLTMLTNAPWSGGTSPIFIWLFLGMGTGSYIAESLERPANPPSARALPKTAANTL